MLKKQSLTILGEPKTRDVLGLVTGLEDAHALVQHVGLVESPERDVALPTGYYLIAVQWVEFCGHYSVYGTLKPKKKC